MTTTEFAYWLQGYFELTDSGQQMSAQQVQIIKDHLNLVFTKVTPNYVPLTSITSYPFYGDKTTEGRFPKPIEYCGTLPDAWKSGYGNITWDEENKVWKNSPFEETIQVSC